MAGRQKTTNFFDLMKDWMDVQGIERFRISSMNQPAYNEMIRICKEQ
jgi:hypothetical protein